MTTLISNENWPSSFAEISVYLSIIVNEDVFVVITSNIPNQVVNEEQSTFFVINSN